MMLILLEIKAKIVVNRKSSTKKFPRPELAAESAPRQDIDSVFGSLAGKTAIDDEAFGLGVLLMEGTE